ncbi:SDR family NAD(P)-dependent oxidoreductase [Spirilliplanes yamanashiensis]|uniref:Short-chain dehydrogenase n=1 Tax=Spirilliplanes yamanashiensis TaxID=42233 RepID=A0A8J3Y5H2_9ACTN|nr:SDR family NAD(P)-dependent oxidoreductase [Spirilliplanes yamanashiensis]MDP9819473.1 NAD(P)-dependent dehydrogenase (short-subunit alcohol dehydrogenase family) [Spirilliplanes yamanashiensis]GIJ01705.1 short-chain dehydrogenase [Spirilliplanes yamanashiensis]
MTVVVLTGASSGIGRAAAKLCAARGDRLVLAARSRAGLEALAEAHAPGALVHTVDVADRVSVEALADAAVARYGRIDVWVDTAAVMAYGRFEDVPAEVFDQVIATDLIGSANVARAALRVFRSQGAGTLVLTGSLVGHVTAPYMSAYATAKWGQRALARTLRQETRDAKHIHVCQVVPGGVDTPIYTSAANYAGRIGRPPPPVDTAERVARVALKLADRPRAEASVGLTNRVVEFGFAALPRVYDALVGPMMRAVALSGRPVDPHEGNVFASRTRDDGGPARWGRGAAAAGAAAAAALSLAGAVALRARRGR